MKHKQSVKKRIWSIFLVCVMLVSMIPTSVFAEETITETETVAQTDHSDDDFQGLVSDAANPEDAGDTSTGAGEGTGESADTSTGVGEGFEESTGDISTNSEEVSGDNTDSDILSSDSENLVGGVRANTYLIPLRMTH